MIDFHTHILHDIDDGSHTLDESVAMARLALEDGITTLVATPHSPASSAGNRYSVTLVQRRLDDLRAALAAAALPLELVAGTELRYQSRMLAHLRAGRLLACGDQRAILLESPGRGLPAGLSQQLAALQQAGYRVVLAHPERIKTVQQRPEELIPLIKRGVAMQLTGHTLLGYHGRGLQRVAERLLTRGLIHLIASDAHGMPPRRAPLLAEARARAAVLVGEAAAAALVEETPRRLLAGEPLDLTLPPPPWRHWFGG